MSKVLTRTAPLWALILAVAVTAAVITAVVVSQVPPGSTLIESSNLE